jgi:hypothetical protein
VLRGSTKENRDYSLLALEIGEVNSVKQPSARRYYDLNAGLCTDFKGFLHRDDSDKAAITYRLEEITVN